MPALASLTTTRGKARRANVLAVALRCAAAMLAIAAAGCASLPSDVARPVSHAQAHGPASTLGHIARASLAQAQSPSGHASSGFALLADDGAALRARLELIARAEQSVDVQYYLIADDSTGREFLSALRDAAGRGVRVRVLVDDLYATGDDGVFSALAALPNIEVRMFNPLPARGRSFAGRVVRSLPQVARINHRMHNKLFVADGSFSIVGGRNMADEYFGRGGGAHFIDMDALAAGAVVDALEAAFDRYWNSDRAYPIASLVAAAAAPNAPSATDGHGEDGGADETASPARALVRQLDQGVVSLIAGDAEASADLPDKTSANEGGRVSAAHLAMIASARSEILLASPYLVPSQPVLDALDHLASGGVRVSVLTNSLAATDEPLAHLGYMQHRVELLRAGVSLHELRPVADMEGGGGGSAAPTPVHRAPGRLHGKLAVVDGETTFIGSMNLDHRSENCNTEDGLIIHSVALATQVAAFLRHEQDSASDELRLGEHRAQLTRTAPEGAPWVDADGDDWENLPGLALRVVARLAKGML